ncbi:AI-2E family transporter [Mycoplasmatota bacterium]|nr:AI-2E family transporter [Mycoplasmatota bacterium]
MNKKIMSLVALFLITITGYYFLRIFPYILNIINFLFSILLPFLYSFIIAFLLAPIVDRFERYGRSRMLAVTIVYIFMILGLSFIFVNLVPIIIDQTELLIEGIPTLIDGIENIVLDIKNYLKFLPDDIEPNFDNFTQLLSSLIEVVYGWIKSSFNNIFSSITVVVLIPIITAYLLYDYNKIKQNLKLYLIKKNKIYTKKFLEKVNDSLGMYVRGLFLVMLILSILSSIGFLIIGLEYYLFFGIIVGLTNAIPIFGAFIGGCFPVLYSLSISFNKAILVLVIIVILQFVESSIVTPYIQSKNMKIHPLLIILSILLFGKLFGFLGVLFAVPLVTLIKITYQFIRNKDMI